MSLQAFEQKLGWLQRLAPAEYKRLFELNRTLGIVIGDLLDAMAVHVFIAGLHGSM